MYNDTNNDTRYNEILHKTLGKMTLKVTSSITTLGIMTLSTHTATLKRNDVQQSNNAFPKLHN
jgi:hypothetical protein